jgi:hypothetical protein
VASRGGHPVCPISLSKSGSQGRGAEDGAASPSVESGSSLPLVSLLHFPCGACPPLVVAAG